MWHKIWLASRDLVWLSIVEPLDFLEKWSERAAVVISLLVMAGLLAGAVWLGWAIPVPSKEVVFVTLEGTTYTDLIEGPRWPFLLGLPTMVLLVSVFIAAVRLLVRARTRIETLELEMKKLTTLQLNVAVAPSEMINGRRSFRFRVSNPNPVPVTKVYGKYRVYHVIKRQSFWRLKSKLPYDGMDLPWNDLGNNSSTVDIGGVSSEYLSFGVEFGSPSVFAHVGMAKQLTDYKLYGGTYEFTLEVGSKAGGVPISRQVRIDFPKQGGITVSFSQPVPDTPMSGPSPTLVTRP